MNKAKNVNIDEISKESLVARLYEVLKGLGDEVSWVTWSQRQELLQGDAGDFTLVGKAESDQYFALVVECKTNPRPSLLPVLFRRRVERPFPVEYTCLPLLGAPYVSPRMAELCKKTGWGWVDLAGNCRIDIPGILHIERSGNPPVHKRSVPSVNLGTPEVARVIRVLLAPHNAGVSFTQRKLKEACEPPVSIGLVNKLVNHLEQEAYLKPASSRGGFHLVEAPALLEAWCKAYRYDRHRYLSMFTLLKGKKLDAALGSLAVRAGDGMALASFSAADFFAPHVRQPRTWLYISERYLESLKETLEAKEVDSGNNLQVLIPEDDGVYFGKGTARHFALSAEQEDDRVPPSEMTSPIQTYVDLRHAGGRGEEAAEALLEKTILPWWEYWRERNDG